MLCCQWFSINLFHRLSLLLAKDSSTQRFWEDNIFYTISYTITQYQHKPYTVGLYDIYSICVIHNVYYTLCIKSTVCVCVCDNRFWITKYYLKSSKRCSKSLLVTSSHYLRRLIVRSINCIAFHFGIGLLGD